MTAALSLADLEAFDPGAEGSGRERRFLCPLCGDSKRRDKSHRSVSVNTDTGAYRCHRCQASGKVKEQWKDRPAYTRRDRVRTQARRMFALPPLQPPAEPPRADAADWRKQLAGLVKLDGTAGAEYLARRGLSLDVASAAGVKFSRSWYGRPAAVFPIRNAGGELVAAHGRHTDGREDPKGHDGGKKSQGVFIGTPGALAGPLLALVEGPACALTLAEYGLASAATMGVAFPAWLARSLFGKRILIATDADAAGDTAARDWESILRAYGASVSRLRPPCGAKDWNDAHALDPGGLAEYLASALAAVAADEAVCDTWEGDNAAPIAAAVGSENLPKPAIAAAQNQTFSDAPTHPRPVLFEGHGNSRIEPVEWPADLLPALEWLQMWYPASEETRVEIEPSVYVTNPAGFAAALRGDIAAGPGRGRDLYGSVKTYLRGAWNVFGCPATTSEEARAYASET